MKRESISILGSTGSIGVNALKAVTNLGGRFNIKYISGFSNYELLADQIKKYKPEFAVVPDHNYKNLKKLTSSKTSILSGDEGLRRACEDENVDTVLNAIVGSFGLKPTVYAAGKGKKICLANKESLVMAGDYIKKLIKRTGSKLVPIDSEHSAMLQALNGENKDNIEKILLTASGGPFRNRKGSLRDVTAAEALNHPNWEMGKKITVDSATLMNKGFELIEVVHLFDVEPNKIEILIHPESIIHSMVRFIDGSVIAQLGMPDMMLPIQYALTYPDRKNIASRRIDFTELGKMTFFKPDRRKFHALALAEKAVSEKGTMPVVLNTVNEIMVYKFLDGKIKFTDIVNNVKREMEAHKNIKNPSIDTIFELSEELWKRLN